MTNKTNFETFAERYGELLKEAIVKDPDGYTSPPENAHAIALHMCRSLLKGTAQLSDVARKAARQLGIPPNYKGIVSYLNTEL